MKSNRYVVGFMFGGYLEAVALIRKKRPAWQAGLLNGIGGHIQPRELAMDAMCREFQEESGCKTEPKDWSYFALLHGVNDCGELFQLHCYAARGMLADCHTQTDEQIEIVSSTSHRIVDYGIENLGWLIASAIDHLKDGRPAFLEVTYK